MGLFCCWLGCISCWRLYFRAVGFVGLRHLWDRCLLNGCRRWHLFDWNFLDNCWLRVWLFVWCIVLLFLFHLHLFWFVRGFLLSGWLAVLYNLGPSSEDMDCFREMFFYFCALVHSGASVKFNVSNFLCGVVNPTEFCVLSYKIVHVFLLCFQRNVQERYKGVISCWWRGL